MSHLEKKSGAKLVELNEKNTCKLCSNALSKYSCPRCGIIYCSLLCYRSEKHLQCSEAFYKECIEEELLTDNSEESKRKMTEILERNQCDDSEEASLDSDDEEDVVEISKRLEGVNLDNADQVWEKLTEDEKQDFVAFLRSEDASKLVPRWEPWWSYSAKKVEEISSSEKYKLRCPKIIMIKNFSQISKKAPADCVKFNLINVLAAYVFATRYFNGESQDFCGEVITCVSTISLVLKANQNFENYETAVASVQHECIESDWIVADEENFSVLREDLEKLLNGPETSERKFYILCALSNLHTLLTSGLKKKKDNATREEHSSFSKSFPNDHFPSVKLLSHVEVKNCLRKTEYLLSYAKDCLVL